MKKSIFSVFLVSVAAVSCTKAITTAEEQSLPKAGITEFTAVIDEAPKTSIDENVVSWTAGDEISVFDEAGTKFKFRATSSGATTIFSKVSEGDLSGSTFYAVYPYSDTTTFSAGVITTATENSYTVDSTGFTGAAQAVMVAKTTTGEFHFKNASSLLKFVVPSGLNLAKLYFYASGADLSGVFSVSIDSEGTPSFTATPSTYNGITLHAEEGKTIPAGTYYLPVIPNTYSNLRIRLTYETEDGAGSEAFSTNSLEIARNTVRSLGTLYDGCRL